MMTMLHSVWSGGGSATGRRSSLLALGALLALIASVLFWVAPSQAQSRLNPDGPPVAVVVVGQPTGTPATVTLDGSGSFDADEGSTVGGSGIVSFKWEVVTEAYSWLNLTNASDAALTPTDTSAKFIVPSATLAARYGQSIEFRLTVTDGDNAPASGSTTVTFNINQGPTADIAVSAMLADPANPDVRGYDDNGNGIKDENAEKYPLDGVIDGPGENGNAENEWDIAEGALITLDGSGSTDPGGRIPPANHVWALVYSTPDTGYQNTPSTSLPNDSGTGASQTGSGNGKLRISTDEDSTADADPRSGEVMTPLLRAGTTGFPASPFFAYYRLTVQDSAGAQNTAVVKLVIHDQPQDPKIDSIVPSANTNTAAGGVATSEISCQTGASGTACETGAPGSGRYVIAPRSAITLTITDSLRDADTLPYSDADGDTPRVTWEGARSTNPTADPANTTAAFTAPADAEEGDEFTITATATDATGRTTSKSVTLVVATNTAPEAVAPGTAVFDATVATVSLYNQITVEDGPDGGDIDPLTKRGTGVVNLRGISHDADGGSLIHAWTELDMAQTGDPAVDTLPALVGSPPAPANMPGPIRPPAKSLISIDGAFSQDASFTVPEVNAQHTTINIAYDLNGDGDTADTGEDAVPALHVPIAFTVLDQWQVKTTKIVIVRIVNTDDKPRANAGPNQQVTPGSFVRLNGAGSSDADPGDRLSYQWEYIGIETDPLTQNRAAITTAEIGLGYVECKWFPYDAVDQDRDGNDTANDDCDNDSTDQSLLPVGTYSADAGGALKNANTAFPYFDAPRLGGFSSIKLKFSLVVTDGLQTVTQANPTGTDRDASTNRAVVTITITDGFYSGNVTGPDFCLVQSLGGPTTYPFDSNFDGVADTCSLNTTRRGDGGPPERSGDLGRPEPGDVQGSFARQSRRH